jgi:hypothetical protein
MHQQLWGYKVEEKLYGGTRTKKVEYYWSILSGLRAGRSEVRISERARDISPKSKQVKSTHASFRWVPGSFPEVE